MTGFRKDNPDSLLPEEGQYGKDASGQWFGMAPGCHFANLSAHLVTENSDGTITVSPSILVKTPGRTPWHGYLRNGVWMEC